jgi:hypothetical protein
MFLPGLARLATRPVSTTSLAPIMTIGMVWVAFAAAMVGPLAGVTRTSTPESMISLASGANSSGRPSALLYLKITFRPAA